VTVLRLDGETYSKLDLKKVNSYIYFEHGSTGVHCVAWAFDDEEPEIWLPGQPVPERVRQHIESGGRIAVWNAMFERLMLTYVLGPKHGWPVPKLEQFECTMAKAYAMGLPGSLDMASPCLGMDEAKDAVGKRVMLQLAKPRRDGTFYTPESHPEKFDTLYAYCKQDVRTERAADKRLVALSPDERQVYLLDQKINDRGVFVDEPFCKAALNIIDQATEALDAEIKVVSDYAVGSLSNANQIKAFVASKGVAIDGLAKDDVVNLLARDDLPADVRRVLEIRQEGAKTSTAKVDKMLTLRQKDGRMRGNLQYHGASTGRWSGRGAQLQNLPRPILGLEPEDAKIVRTGDAKFVQAMLGPPMTVVADSVRGMIAAAPGNVIMAADFAAIEARVLGWLAGQESILKAFREFDAGTGPDIYKMTAKDIYSVPVQRVDKAQRQVGKVAVLALGYQGGPGAFRMMAKGYGLDIASAFEPVYAAATKENVDKAEAAWLSRGKATGMSQRAWLTAELIKLAWREANDKIVQFWYNLESAAISAIENKGEVFYAGDHVRFKKSGSWLVCGLPSGRNLYYAYPKVEEKTTPWGTTQKSVTIRGVDRTRNWSDISFYGGLISENVTQAVARDLMVNGMLACEAAGYPAVITIHDEIVVEPPAGHGSVEEFEKIMATGPAWAEGLPLAAEGWVGERYRK
jgi:DNA polymerase bacteriophage-type